MAIVRDVNNDGEGDPFYYNTGIITLVRSFTPDHPLPSLTLTPIHTNIPLTYLLHTSKIPLTHL
jgi:hypothetical protein